jgi:hypothetical protein
MGNKALSASGTRAAIRAIERAIRVLESERAELRAALAGAENPGRPRGWIRDPRTGRKVWYLEEGRKGKRLDSGS